MMSDYQIYIEKTSCISADLFRVFVLQGGNVVSIYAHVSEDKHQRIYLGKVNQTFQNNKAKIKITNKDDVYTERAFKEHNINVGEEVWVQTKSVSPSEMDYKEYKGTLNIALPLGPIILYPFDSGIHISKRLKQYPEFANSLKHHFQKFSGAFGIKFRLSAKNYTFQQLEKIISFLKHIWLKGQYNHLGFLITSSLVDYFLSSVEVFTNDISIKNWLTESVKFIFAKVPKVNKLQEGDENLEDAWDLACRKVINLPKGGSLFINETPACVVIDVNAGAETYYEQVNKEVVKLLPEFLYQGRFGGKFVVDLLPIHKREEAVELINIFNNACHAKDISIQSFGISKMGLLEFIIPRRGYPLWWIDKKFIKTKIVLDK
ncbi:MAG: ribonuclease E/G [Candidatus Paracaedibacteraceae bacterium]|nr:ribonuclease E/G [Candidatus Paracaedibacteraceae bacterium]